MQQPPQQPGPYQQPPNQQYYPYMPPTVPPPRPPRKKLHFWRYVIAIIIVLMLIAVCRAAGSMDASGTSATPTAGTAPPTQQKSQAAVLHPTATLKATSIVKLTSAQKQQVKAILDGSIKHYQDLLTGGKTALGTTQYADGNAGLVAMNDPNSNASKFSAWRQTSKAETDLSYLDAFKQADAFYNVNNEPAAISTWRDDMGTAQSDLAQWISVAADWQIRVKTTQDLTTAETTFAQDIKQVQSDETNTLSAS